MTATRLKGLDHIADNTLEEELKINLMSFFDWGFLNKGSYTNVNLNSSGTFGGQQERLRPVVSPWVDQPNGTVWEGFRKDWVWESGLDKSPQPIQVSGVYVDGNFLSLASGVTVNYPEGKITLDDAVSTSSVVTCEYTYKWIQFVDAKELPFFKEVQYRSNRVDDSHFLASSSGDWYQFGSSRVQMPTVAVEIVSQGYTPFQLGGGQYAQTDVFFHVLAESDHDAKKIAGIISKQNEKTIYMFNTNKMVAEDAFPLNYQGSINAGAKTYDQLVMPSGEGGFRGNKCRMYNTAMEQGNWITQSLYMSTAKITTEVILTNI